MRFTESVGVHLDQFGSALYVFHIVRPLTVRSHSAQHTALQELG